MTKNKLMALAVMTLMVGSMGATAFADDTDMSMPAQDKNTVGAEVDHGVNDTKHETKKVWHETQKESKEAWDATKDGSKKAWNATKNTTKRIGSGTKKEADGLGSDVKTETHKTKRHFWQWRNQKEGAAE